MRWLNQTQGCMDPCFDGVEFSRLLPDEDVTETSEGVALLKQRLAVVRKRMFRAQCLALAAQAGRLSC
jgi:hypothetical protein